jgi:glycerol kinase
MVLIGVDQGTTGTRTVAFDDTFAAVASAYRPVASTHPQPGWISKDPLQVVHSVEETLAEVIDAVGGVGRVAAVGLDNEGETILAWDSVTLAPLSDAIVWGCRRSQPVVDRLRDAGVESQVRAATGLPLDPYFSSTKIRFLLEHEPAVRAAAARGTLRFGTLDAYITLRLGGSARTEPSTAARTQLQALRRPGAWDASLCDLFGVDPATLPRIGASVGDLGVLRVGDACVALRAMLVDQTAALAGHGCFATGAVKATYGTGIFVLENAGPRIPTAADGLLTVIAWQVGGVTTYALDGGVFSAGTVIDWLGSGLGLFDDAAVTERMARSVADTGGVWFLPALAGLGAPWWRAQARGVFSGLTSATTPAHLVRAALDALCFRVVDIVDAMSIAAGRPSLIRIDGGLTANRYLVQRQADTLGMPVIVAGQPEATALGVAAMAGVGAAITSFDEISRRVGGGERVEPHSDGSAQVAAWRVFVERASAL